MSRSGSSSRREVSDVTRVGGKWRVQNHRCPRTSGQGNHVEEKYPTYPTFSCGLSFRCLVSLEPGPTSCQRVSLRVDRLQTTGLTHGPATSDVAIRRSSFGSSLQPFLECQDLCVWRPASRYRKEQPPRSVSVWRSISNIPLLELFGILNA